MTSCARETFKLTVGHLLSYTFQTGASLCVLVNTPFSFIVVRQDAAWYKTYICTPRHIWVIAFTHSYGTSHLKTIGGVSFVVCLYSTRACRSILTLRIWPLEDARTSLGHQALWNFRRKQRGRDIYITRKKSWRSLCAPPTSHHTYDSNPLTILYI